MVTAATARPRTPSLDIDFDLGLPIFAGLIALLVTIGWFALPTLPLQDLPNHAARGLVMADLLFHHGREFGDRFELHLEPQPYLLGDLLLSVLTQLGPTFAARAF